MASDKLPAPVPPHKHVGKSTSAGGRQLLAWLSYGDPPGNHCRRAVQPHPRVVHVIAGRRLPAIGFTSKVLRAAGYAAVAVGKKKLGRFDRGEVFVITIQIGR